MVMFGIIMFTIDPILGGPSKGNLGLVNSKIAYVPVVSSRTGTKEWEAHGYAWKMNYRSTPVLSFMHRYDASVRQVLQVDGAIAGSCACVIEAEMLDKIL